jgi:nuclear transport factor 2 (NTF2) superfamily protein
MTDQQATSKLDLETLNRAYESRDAELALSLYTDDAGVRIVDRNNTPSSPRELHGKEEIDEYLRDVFSRDTTHQLEREIIAKDRVAFNVACQYPDGVRVLAAESMELREGKVAEQVELVAWDE